MGVESSVIIQLLVYYPNCLTQNSIKKKLKKTPSSKQLPHIEMQEENTGWELAQEIKSRLLSALYINYKIYGVGADTS